MLAKILAVVLLSEAALCQENADPVRRLRFRRPRPKLIDVDNPDGDLRGSPVELRLAESELSAAVAEEPTNFRSQNRGSAALDALIATAQREEPAPAPQPQVLEIEEIPTQRPLRLSPASDAAQAPVRSQRVRQRGGVPNRRRPRPEGQEPRRGEQGPRRRPSGDREVEEPVATLERYSHKNEDGSFTFGYVGADGSFREETRGADCITRGKYGYIDPEGVKREYTYTSGLPCEVGDDDLDLQNIDGDINIEDPVDPRERFRQTQNEQLTDAQIPAAARPRRPIQRRPAENAGEANTFSNFGGNSQRAQQVPERRPAPTRVAQPSGNALQSLQAIASGQPSAQAAPVRPAPVRIAPRPTQAPARPATQGTFDFDAELEGFTLNRPSITFEQNKNSAAPNSFQSQLSFNQNTGTFQTNLQQNVQGGQQISLVNNNAPSGVVTTAAPAPQTAPIGTTFAATRASPRPASVFQNSTPRPAPAPTSFPARANPSPAPQGTKTVPAGTFQLGFEPLNIPDIAAVQVKLPPPTPAPSKIAPTPAPTQKPAPAPTQRPTQPPTQRPTPVRITLTEAPRQSQPVRVATTAATSPAAPVTAAPSAPAAPTTPAAPSSPAAPANTFFVFQPFSQQPASAPFRTPVNPNAFKVNPAPPQPRPVQPRPAQPQPQAARPVQPQPARPVPQIPQRVPIPQTGAPQQAAAPQLQFGFSPVQQAQPQRPAQPPRPVQPQQVRPAQPPRPAPQQFQARPPAFTAFRGQQVQQVQQARPPPQQVRPQQQLQARPPPQQFQARPQQFQQPQLGIPPQLQQQRPGAPQFAQFDSRFAPRPQGQQPGQVQFRPAQFQPGQPQQQPSSQFSVFNPAQQLRGA